MSHPLEYYVRSLGQISLSAFLERIDCPVLVESVVGGDDAHDNERAFRTEFVSVDELDGPGLGSMIQGEVLLVKKKEGALFSGHIGVGRTPNLDVCIPRHGISKFHGYFSVDPNGGYRITDKDSKNGTYLDGKRLEPGVATPIGNSAELRFAAHAFRFMMPDAFYQLVQSYAA